MMTVKCAAEIVRELSIHPSSSNILGKSESRTEDIKLYNKTSFSDLAKEMEFANHQRVAAAAAAAQILSAAAAVAQAAQKNDTESHQQQSIKISPSQNHSRDFMASVTSKSKPKSKLTFSVDSLLSTKSATIPRETNYNGSESEDSKPEDLSVTTADEEEEDNEDEINVNDDDNDYLDEEEDDDDRRNSSFSPGGANENRHNLEALPKLAMPTPLLPGSSSHLSGSSPYLAGYLAAVAAANGSSINSNGSQITTSAPNPTTAATLLSAINRWPSPAGGIPPGFPFGGMQNPFLRPGNYVIFISLTFAKFLYEYHAAHPDLKQKN
jgi:hypothetical protein